MHPRLFLSCLFLAACVSLTGTPAGEPKKAEPINLACNTDGDEVDPYVGSDGRVLYYSLKPKDGKRFAFTVSRRASPAANWGKAEPLDEPHMTTKVDDRGISTTAEGVYKQYAFFATRKDSDKDGSFDLYVAIKEGRDRVFSAVAPVRNVSTKDDEMHPWLSADTRALYFSRKSKDGWQLMVARRTEVGVTQGFDDVKPVAGIPINFHCATTTPDGKTMYLQGPLESGKVGLHVTKWNGKEWDKPAPLDLLNHPESATGDMMPTLTRDGTKLYFASDRPGGKGGLDLWVVPVAQLTGGK